MDLYEILNDCTVQIRNGPVVTEELVGVSYVTTIDAMPSEGEVKPGLKIVDMILLKIGVDADKAEAHRAEFVKLIEPLRAQLEPGPSYIAIGAWIGDQGAAFQMMAIGEVLGLWKVITPKTFGMEGEQLRLAAGNGYVMISGYRREGENDLAQTEREAG